MLYDVLPPLFFFASLGGIILVVSRVVLRIRRQEFAASPTPPQHKVTNLAELVGPSTKNVHVFRNRAAHLVQATTAQIAHSKTALKESIAQRQERRAARKSLKESAQQAKADSIKEPSTPITQRFLARAGAVGQVAKRGAGHAKKIKQVKKILPQRQPKAAPPTVAASQPTPTPSLRIVEKPTPPKPSTNTAKAKPAPAPKLFKKKSKPKPATPIEQAQQAIREAHHDQAEDILVPYLAKHPRDAKAYMLLGKAACGRENWEEAIEVYEQVVSLHPTVKGAAAALGHAAFRAGKFTKAIESLRRAHDEDPQDVAVIKDLLTIAQRMDNLPMQQSLTAELATLEPSKPSPPAPAQSPSAPLE